MREITPQLNEKLKAHFKDSVAKADAYPMATYTDLVRIIAELSYLNRNKCLLFRGQGRDFRNKAGASTLYPSLYRRTAIAKPSLEHDFSVLKELSSILIEEIRKVDRRSAEEVKKRLCIPWAILQHYQVYETPLLDLTQSIRAACSFALDEVGKIYGETQNSPLKGGDEFAFVYVLGLPYMNSGISIDSQEEIISLRLLSACPSLALRPYFQDAFLAGTVDITDNYDDKNELDFNRRLIAKFAIPNDDAFWNGSVHKIPNELLFLDKDNDLMYKICSYIHLAVMQAKELLFESGENTKEVNELTTILRKRLIFG